MALYITTSSQAAAEAEAVKNRLRTEAVFELVFETEEEVQRAGEGLWIGRYAPDVFRLLPDFAQYDPTHDLPGDLRNRALKMTGKRLAFQSLADVSGQPSVVSSKEGAVLGSVLWIMYNRPLEHALRLFYIMTKTPSRIEVRYNYKTSEVELRDQFDVVGLSFKADADEWTTRELMTSLAENRPVGIGFPKTAETHELMMKREHFATGDMLPFEFFSLQDVGDWYLVHTRGSRVIRQLNKKATIGGSDLQLPTVQRSPYVWFQQQMAASV